MLIRWSDEDQAYIVTLPEFDNATTHGETYEQAAREGRLLIESCILWDREDGKALPKPSLFVYPGEVKVLDVHPGPVKGRQAITQVKHAIA
ncbi:MAG TPA: type II toxin-antitoxin system HicB family antitoxin [Tepidisphaeraceae bacterium]|nr:type II toxin-antitoxin system HicB family antitoxin [Tepidisphaeraceae bacterium]